LADRSVVAELKRRRPSDTIARLRIGRMQHLHELRRRIVRWIADHEERIAERDPEIPSIIDREADNWQVLLAIADEAGGEWPERARKVAVASHGSDEEGDNVARLELLLWDIRNAFAEEGTEMPDMFGATQVIISSVKLVKILAALEGHPWAEMGKERKPLTPNGLAWMLKPLAITPGKVGPRDKRVNGYVHAHFSEAFERYLSPRGANRPDTRSQPDEMGASDFSQVDTEGHGVHSEKGGNPNDDGPASECPVYPTEKGGKAYVWPERSSDLPYTGPVVEVPDQGPDPLDEHGTPRTAPTQPSKGDEPGLSSQRIRELADWYREQTHRRYNAGTLDVAALDAELRAILRKEVASPEQVEIEFQRVMNAALAM
jgi:hypothetical protein